MYLAKFSTVIICEPLGDLRLSYFPQLSVANELRVFGRCFAETAPIKSESQKDKGNVKKEMGRNSPNTAILPAARRPLLFTRLTEHPRGLLVSWSRQLQASAQDRRLDEPGSSPQSAQIIPAVLRLAQVRPGALAAQPASHLRGTSWTALGDATVVCCSPASLRATRPRNGAETRRALQWRELSCRSKTRPVFIHDYEKPPPGLIKENETKPEDCIPDVPGNESAREFLAHAPTKGLWMPLGKEVKVMQCWRCKRYGHRTGDKECPFFIKGNQKLEQFRVAHEDPMYDIIRENKRHEKEMRIQQLKQLLEDSTSEDDDDNSDDSSEDDDDNSSSSTSSECRDKHKKKKRKKEKKKKEKKKKKKKKHKSSKSNERLESD
nr:PREDICTED: retinitis pigmentosa 9 protein [Struthio camelus australis]